MRTHPRKGTKPNAAPKASASSQAHAVAVESGKGQVEHPDPTLSNLHTSRLFRPTLASTHLCTALFRPEEIDAGEKARLADEAIAAIQWAPRSVASAPLKGHWGFPRQGVRVAGNQKAGAPFVPEGWAEKYKPALGSYKQPLRGNRRVERASLSLECTAWQVLEGESRQVCADISDFWIFLKRCSRIIEAWSHFRGWCRKKMGTS